MLEQDAITIIERRVRAGGVLRMAYSGDLPTIKALQEQCLARDIPALMGPCSSGG